MADALDFGTDGLAALDELSGKPTVPEEIKKKVKGLQSKMTEATQEAAALRKKLEEAQPFDPVLQHLKSRGLDPNSAIAAIDNWNAIQQDLSQNPDKVVEWASTQKKRLELQRMGLDADKVLSEANGNGAGTRPNAAPSKAEEIAQLALAKTGMLELESHLGHVRGIFKEAYGLDPDPMEIAKTLKGAGWLNPTREQVMLAAKTAYEDKIMDSYKTNLEKQLRAEISGQLKNGGSAKVWTTSGGAGTKSESSGHFEEEGIPKNVKGKDAYNLAAARGIERINNLRRERG